MTNPLFTPEDVELMRRCVEGLDYANGDRETSCASVADDEAIFPDSISIYGRDWKRFASLADRLQHWIDQQATPETILASCVARYGRQDVDDMVRDYTSPGRSPLQVAEMVAGAMQGRASWREEA